jgi:ABC-type nitrate/sulfonate/bicarbonate transport system permease component
MPEELPDETSRPLADKSRTGARYVAAVGDFLRADVLATLLALLFACLGWQLVALLLDTSWLPTWFEVQGRVGDLLGDPEFRSALATSIRDMLIGYAIAVVSGLIVGLGLGMNQFVDDAARHYLDMLLFVPPVVTAPIFLSMFGLSRTTLVALVVLFAAPIIAVSAKAAVLDVDRSTLDAARSFGASKMQATRLVLVRAALPGIFTGLHLGMGRAVKGMIIGQLILAVIGVGAYEARFQRTFDAAGLWSIAVIVVVTAIIFSWFVVLVDRIVNAWVHVAGR